MSDELRGRIVSLLKQSDTVVFYDYHNNKIGAADPAALIEVIVGALAVKEPVVVPPEVDLTPPAFLRGSGKGR